VGPHKTSTLQDAEAGRPLEIGALVNAVVELGRLTGAPTPYIGAVYGEAAGAHLRRRRRRERPTEP